MKIFQEFPVLGSGPGTFRIYFPQFRAPNYFDNEISHVTLYSHNYFFDLLAETGVLGFAAYILFLGTIWLGCMRNGFTHPSARMRLLCLAAAVALVGMYGSNLTSPNARWVIGGSSLWTVLGFASGLLTRANFSRRQESLATPTALGWAGNSKLLYAAATVGTIMFIFSFREATSYWKGSVFYADGLRRMDPVYNAMQSGAQPNAKMTQLLEESLTYFNKAVKAYPNHVSSYYKMGSAYTNLYSIYGSRREAAQNPKERENLEYQANIYLERAKDSYERLTLELYPDYAEIHYNMGVIYPIYAKYLEEKAAAESDAARKRELLAQAADYETRSVEHLEKMVKMSLREEVAMRAGMEFMKQGKTTRTLEVFRDAAKEHPKSEQLNRYYYQVAANASSPEDVAEANANLWRMEPANDEYLNALMMTCFNAKLFDRAEAIANELEAINPVDPRIQEIRIISAAEQGDDPKVLELWRKYRALEGKDMKICTRIMEIAARLDDTETLEDIQSVTGLTTESLTAD
jgi:hypothetical protein